MPGSVTSSGETVVSKNMGSLLCRQELIVGEHAKREPNLDRVGKASLRNCALASV